MGLTQLFVAQVPEIVQEKADGTNTTAQENKNV